MPFCESALKVQVPVTSSEMARTMFRLSATIAVPREIRTTAHAHPKILEQFRHWAGRLL